MSAIQKRISLAFLLFVLFLTNTSTHAQQPRILWQKDLFDENLITDDPKKSTWIFPIVGDVEGDSNPEVILGLWGGKKNIVGKKVMVLNGADGATKWEYELGGAMYHSINLIQDRDADSKTLVVGSYDGSIYFFNSVNGTLLKKIEHGEKVKTIASADINNDGTTDYIVMGDDTRMAAYNGETGKRLWEIRSNKYRFINPVIKDIDSDGFVEVVSVCNGNEVTAIDAKTGGKKWIRNLGTMKVMLLFTIPNQVYATPVAADIDGKTSIVVGTGCTGEMIVLNAKSGRPFIRKKLSEANLDKNIDGSITNMSTGDLDGDGLLDLAVVSYDKKVYGVNGKNLEKFWEFKTGREISSSPSLADMNNDGMLDVVMVGNDDIVYCINGKNGILIWKYGLGSNYDSGHALLADLNGNGLIDIVVSGSTNGNLLVLETEAKCKPHEILWGKSGGNNRNNAVYGEK
jgi:outer membrane protein assembly factor BamB